MLSNGSGSFTATLEDGRGAVADGHRLGDIQQSPGARRHYCQPGAREHLIVAGFSLVLTAGTSEPSRYGQDAFSNTATGYASERLHFQKA